MKHRVKNSLRALSRHLGLKVKFVNYLADNIHGKLLPREKRILINAHKPRCEHIFTLLHEIGHFLMHFKGPARKHHPRFFDTNWKADRLACLSSTIRRYFRYIFNKTSGREWEADLWAMCAFIYLAKRVGCGRELHAFLNRHPEKLRVFLLAGLGVIYVGIKTKIKRIGRLLTKPVEPLRSDFVS
jgi:IrrE N-terminal-like domain